MAETERDIEICYFAAARELAGCATERLLLPPGRTDVGALCALLAARHPGLAPVIGRMRLAINDELVHDDAELSAGDQVSVLPPVAGGSGVPFADAVTLCQVQDGPLSVDRVLQALSHPGAGGISLFVGVVRDHAEGKPVARLDYEAHPTMAQRQLQRVLEEVAGAHAGARLATVHRVGTLQVGDLAIVVGASSPHRAQAFSACRAAIEAIKLSVPIWKKEWAPDGSANWVNLEG